MDSTASDMVFRYPHPSLLVEEGASQTLHLAACDSRGLLFDGLLTRPQLAARLLGTISLVVTTRFHVAASALNSLLDPVVTVGREDLRFEGFSGCAGVHALAVFGPDSHADGMRSVGTTNVDFGEDMRAALAGVRDADGLRLRVGTDEVAVQTRGTSVLERRVSLPERWVRSFLESTYCAKLAKLRTRLLSRVFGMEAVARPWVQHLGSRQVGCGDPREALPRHAVPLTSAPESHQGTETITSLHAPLERGRRSRRPQLRSAYRLSIVRASSRTVEGS